MLVIDRGDAGLARADQADRIVAAADAGLEHGEVASALLEVEAGQRKQRLERAELFAEPFRDLGDGGLDPLLQAGKCSSPISTPSTWIRSLKRNRCGEVKSPVRKP